MFLWILREINKNPRAPNEKTIKWNPSTTSAEYQAGVKGCRDGCSPCRAEQLDAGLPYFRMVCFCFLMVQREAANFFGGPHTLTQKIYHQGTAILVSIC